MGHDTEPQNVLPVLQDHSIIAIGLFSATGFSGFGMPRFSLRRLLMRGRLPLTTDSTLSAC